MEGERTGESVIHKEREMHDSVRTVDFDDTFIDGSENPSTLNP